MLTNEIENTIRNIIEVNNLILKNFSLDFLSRKRKIKQKKEHNNVKIHLVFALLNKIKSI